MLACYTEHKIILILSEIDLETFEDTFILYNCIKLFEGENESDKVGHFGGAVFALLGHVEGQLTVSGDNVRLHLRHSVVRRH